MSLGLEIMKAARNIGVPTHDVSITGTRSLTPEDAETFMTTDRPAADRSVRRIRTRHHEAARLMASGSDDIQISVNTGLSTSTIRVLRSDPAFANLRDHYNSLRDDKFEVMHERLAALGKDAVSELHDRLEDKPEDFEISDLIKLTTTTADRTGFGPSSSTNVNVTVGIAERLQAARENVKKMKTINAENAENALSAEGNNDD